MQGFNQELRQQLQNRGAPNYHQLIETLKDTAQRHFTLVTRTKRKKDRSQATEDLLSKRAEARNQQKWEEAEELNKLFRKALEWTEHSNC